jgi:hypothetical protein
MNLYQSSKFWPHVLTPKLMSEVKFDNWGVRASHMSNGHLSIVAHVGSSHIGIW